MKLLRIFVKTTAAISLISSVMMFNGCANAPNVSTSSHTDNSIGTENTYCHESHSDDEMISIEYTEERGSLSVDAPSDDEPKSCSDSRPDGDILSTEHCEYIEEYDGYCVEFTYSKDSYDDREWIYDVVFRVRSEDGDTVDGVVRSPAMWSYGGTQPKGTRPEMEVLHFSAGDIAVIKVPVFVEGEPAYIASFYYFDEDELIELSLNFPTVMGDMTVDLDSAELSFTECDYKSSEWTTEIKTYHIDLTNRKMTEK